jgi:hypothetical protein
MDNKTDVTLASNRRSFKTIIHLLVCDMCVVGISESSSFELRRILVLCLPFQIQIPRLMQNLLLNILWILTGTGNSILRPAGYVGSMKTIVSKVYRGPT